MTFELTNDQRKNLGLQIVLSSWDKTKINDETFVYFEGNTIRKKNIG